MVEVEEGRSKGGVTRKILGKTERTVRGGDGRAGWGIGKAQKKLLTEQNRKNKEK